MRTILLCFALLFSFQARADDLGGNIYYNAITGTVQGLAKTNGYVTVSTNTNVPFVYSFNTLSSPSAGVATVFPAGSVYSVPSWMTFAYSSGTITITVNQPGWYRISLDGENNFGNAYTSVIETTVIGGTAATYASAWTITWAMPSASANLNFAGAETFYANVSAAGQTITLLPKVNVNAASVNSSSTYVISAQRL